MRSITQGREPQALRRWKRSNRQTPQNLDYDLMPGDVRQAVKEALLQEQGGLCAYTLQRLDGVQACHVEHIEPQNQQPAKALDYANMAACFPADGGDTSHGYGAPVKGGAPVALNVDFVSPHARGCEVRFRFGADGKVAPAAGDAAAEQTIERLQLNHPALADLRKRALASWGLTLSQRGLRVPTPRQSAAQAAQLATSIVRPDPATGLLEPFCTAIAQVAKAYAAAERSRARRMRKEKR